MEPENFEKEAVCHDKNKEVSQHGPKDLSAVEKLDEFPKFPNNVTYKMTKKMG